MNQWRALKNKDDVYFIVLIRGVGRQAWLRVLFNT